MLSGKPLAKRCRGFRTPNESTGGEINGGAAARGRNGQAPPAHSPRFAGGYVFGAHRTEPPGKARHDPRPSLRRFKGHTETIWGVAFSADDRHAISGSGDGTLRLWRLPDAPPAKAQR